MPFSLASLIGKVEVTLGGILNKPALKEKGLAKQKAAADKTPARTEVVSDPGPHHDHATPEEQLAAEGAPGNTVLAGGGGHAVI
ncbi:hypothetical protein FRC08_013329 [Ceratobasidium sp. 394]|nr:hypothetical protein FRC08_013329 [Ceratobasidium sp. 394]KAG9077738.1 hypothetical protein FS749_010335 [Ceratobasidium sp. UAMH 11750]